VTHAVVRTDLMLKLTLQTAPPELLLEPELGGAYKHTVRVPCHLLCEHFTQHLLHRRRFLRLLTRHLLTRAVINIMIRRLSLLEWAPAYDCTPHAFQSRAPRLYGSRTEAPKVAV